VISFISVRRLLAPWKLVRAVGCDITALIRGRRLLWAGARRGVVVLIIPVSVAVELEELSNFLSFNLTIRKE
jgi:hypothetical protein